MTASARVLLSELPKGHRLPEATFKLSDPEAAAYLAAVEDANPLYEERGLAPPLSVAARALRALLETLELPPGTLHTGQEVEARAGVPLDAALTLTGGIAQRSERAGMVISVIEFQVTPEGAPGPAVVGRTTVMAPAAGATGAES